jgi:RHS repeat-associated protein
VGCYTYELHAGQVIHMGGRVYDPNIGRFLSADLFVQSPYSSQSFNRYSYVFNNPTSNVDPTGDYCDIIWSNRGTPDASTAIDTSTCGGTTSTPIDVTYGDYEITLIAAEPPRPTPGSTRDDSRDEKLADDSIKPVTWDLDLIGAGIGASLKAGLLIVGKVSEKVAAKSLAGTAGKVFSKEKQALVDMAKTDKKTGMTSGDMKAYKELNKELKDPFPDNKVRHDPGGSARYDGNNGHGHVGPVNHIPIND